MSLKAEDIQKYLETRANLFKLKQDMVLFYAKQRPTTLISLQNGLVQTRFDGRRPVDFRREGLYFYDEFIKQQEMNYSARVVAGSEIWLITRTELSALLMAMA
jgi:hypothetical protein